ncbi:MAG: glycerate kinase [Spirosomataceae bacterium]
MHVLICPDKFKGSLPAARVAAAMAKGLPIGTTHTILPLADGGEGSLEVIASFVSGTWIDVHVQNPLFKSIFSSYYLSGNKAFIEMARASGLALLPSSKRKTIETSTFGTGQLIQDALQRGANEIFLFVGGSATTEGGIGMATALGFQFLDVTGKVVLPIGKNLLSINQIVSPVFELNVSFTVICDVENPLIGLTGAAAVYGPQKGATRGDIKLLDDGLRHLALLAESAGLPSRTNIPGAGAAGGLAWGAMTFLNAQLKSGTDFIFELMNFAQFLQKADIVLTGEGKMDFQTLHGKLIHGVASMALSYQKPVWVVCGKNELNTTQHQSMGVEKVAQLLSPTISFEEAVAHVETLIALRTQQLFLA